MRNREEIEREITNAHKDPDLIISRVVARLQLEAALDNRDLLSELVELVRIANTYRAAVHVDVADPPPSRDPHAAGVGYPEPAVSDSGAKEPAPGSDATRTVLSGGSGAERVPTPEEIAAEVLPCVRGGWYCDRRPALAAAIMKERERAEATIADLRRQLEEAKAEATRWFEELREQDKLVSQLRRDAQAK
jgi:hypothetical protein